MISRVSFSGAGWKASFHLGVAKFLNEFELVDRTDLKVGGSSAGAMVALAFLLNKDMEGLHRRLLEAADLVHYKYGVFGGNWSAVASKILIEFYELDKKPQLHATIEDRLFINVTLFPLQRTLYSRFESNEHLLDVMLASAFIPTVAEKRTRPGAGWFYYDGSVSNNFPDPGEDTLRVGFSLGPFGTQPHIKPSLGGGLLRVVRPDKELMQKLFDDGYRQSALFFLSDKPLPSWLQRPPAELASPLCGSAPIPS